MYILIVEGMGFAANAATMSAYGAMILMAIGLISE